MEEEEIKKKLMMEEEEIKKKLMKEHLVQNLP
jgi:hypothetical protein